MRQIGTTGNLRMAGVRELQRSFWQLRPITFHKESTFRDTPIELTIIATDLTYKEFGVIDVKRFYIKKALEQ